MKHVATIGGKGTNNELHDNNSFFERVAMSGPGLSVVINGSDSTIHFANDMFVDYMGQSRVVLEGRQFAAFLEPYQRERFYRHLQEVHDRPAAGNNFVIYNLRNSAGESTAVYLYASKVLGDMPGDEEMYHLFMLLDRSKWGMPFTSFEKRELFLELFDAEGFGTFEWIVDVDKIFWSSGVYTIYEVDFDERSINFDFANRFVHPVDRVRVKENIQQALTGLSDLNIEYRIITGKNNVRLVRCLGRVIKDKNDKPVNLAGSIRDITSQRSIENNLKEMVSELHRSNKELEEFAYAASHDLQEPLRKITTFSDRLLEKYKNALSGEGEMYLSRMVASAENMRLLINGLLDFSRISKTSAPFVPVNLDHLLMEVMNDLELKIEETGTAIRCTGLPEVEAVGSQMKQLFQNLLSNAIKFHKPAVPPIIRIEQEEIAEGELARHNLFTKSRYFKIVFTDNGIGFENEYAARIFQVFQRLHGKSEYPGSGIGLAICKKILEYHHGVIYAENLPGKGARFVMLIPERQ